MNRDATLLRLMLCIAENVKQHAEGTCSNFTKERAISYELITLGEAVKDLSTPLKQAHSHIPWQLISGTRDRLAHDYEDISSKIVWDIATTHLPKLVHDITGILNAQEGSHA